MANYLETNYSVKEDAENQYPQKLCDYIFDNYFKKYIEKIGKEKTKLLDVGSGKGNHLLAFQRRGINVYGLDKRNECKKALENVEISECDIEKDKIPFSDNSFDFIFSKSVIEHVSNTDNFLSEILRVLKPEGVAVIMTPDWGTQYKSFFDDYTHVSPFTRKGLQNAMKINGFYDIKCVYFLQLPFIWKRPYLKFLTKIVSILPDFLKWKDKEESKHRKLIRFSKEKMLLAVATKKVKN